MQKINLNHLDKSNWESFRFDEIAHRIAETVNPNTTDLTIYVGLEHIDAENIHIKRYGSPSDVSGGKLKCYPGDVIFGKRRAYQRKAAIVDFEGICSAHAFVFRANPKVIDPKLFPFFLHSDPFMHCAVDISVGGLSPTINWSDLKGQTFLLPPKAEQARLAELLWAMDEVIEKEKLVLEKLGKYKHSLNEKHFSGYKYSNMRIGEFAVKVGSGVTPEGGSKVYIDEGVIFIRSQNVLNGEFDFNDVAYISDTIDEKMSATRVLRNDVLLNITGASIGRSSVYNLDKRANVNQHVCIIRCNELLEPIFLCEFLNSTEGQNQINLYQAGGNREGLNFSNIRLMKFPNYDIKGQRQLIVKYNLITKARDMSRDKITASQSLQKSLINQIF